MTLMVLEEIFPRMPEVSWLDNVCLFILILAAFNWVAFAFWQINFIDYIPEDLVKDIVYVIIGFSGVKALFFWKKCLACTRID